MTLITPSLALRPGPPPVRHPRRAFTLPTIRGCPLPPQSRVRRRPPPYAVAGPGLAAALPHPPPIATPAHPRQPVADPAKNLRRPLLPRLVPNPPRRRPCPPTTAIFNVYPDGNLILRSSTTFTMTSIHRQEPVFRHRHQPTLSVSTILELLNPSPAPTSSISCRAIGLVAISNTSPQLNGHPEQVATQQYPPRPGAAVQSVPSFPSPAPSTEPTDQGLHPALLGFVAALLVLLASRLTCFGLKLDTIGNCVTYLFGGALSAWMYATVVPPPPNVIITILVGMTWLYFVRTLFTFGDVFRKALVDHFSSGGGTT